MEKNIRSVSTLGYSRIICLPKDWVKGYKKLLLKREFDKKHKKEILKLIPVSEEGDDVQH